MSNEVWQTYQYYWKKYREWQKSGQPVTFESFLGSESSAHYRNFFASNKLELFPDIQTAELLDAEALEVPRSR